MQNPILDVIINILKYSKSQTIDAKEVRIAAFENNGITYAFWNPDYILGQLLRQYIICKDKFFLSKKAAELWNKISSKDIWMFSYRDKIVCEFDNIVWVKSYAGASSKFTLQKLCKNNTFIFNDVFHDDHIVPISIIKKELFNLSDYTYENVSKVLDKICICRMLKEEDRKIKEKSKRFTDHIKVINEIYSKYNIEILNQLF